MRRWISLTKKEVLKMWKKYHEICFLYRGKPIPSLLKYENIFFCSEIEEKKATMERNREISKKNAEIKEIIYILENEHKIENVIKNLAEAFEFSREDIEENIGFYDALFILSWNEIFDRVTFFIELFGSKENFFSAMRIGTPNMRIDELEDLSIKGFLGIMHYKRMYLFKDKLNSLANTLSLSQNDATKIFVSNCRYLYNSARATEEIINQWSSILNVTNKQLGQALKKHPCYLSYGKNAQLKDLIQHFMRCFSISREDSVKIIMYRPDIVNAPLYSIKETLQEGTDFLPAIVSQKSWLYPIYYIACVIYGGYDYGNYETVLEFIKHIEKNIGSIVDVEYRSINPRIREGVRWNRKITYCAFVVKKVNSENEYCFVSLGSGYRTYKNSREPQTAEERLLRTIFGEKSISLTEFIVDISSLYGEDYNRNLDRLIIMSATGNITPCDCALKDGTSIVVEEVAEDQYKNFEYRSVACMFKTLNIIPTSQVEEYKKKYTPQPTANESDCEDFDESLFDDEYLFDDDFEYEEELK